MTCKAYCCVCVCMHNCILWCVCVCVSVCTCVCVCMCFILSIDRFMHTCMLVYGKKKKSAHTSLCPKSHTNLCTNNTQKRPDVTPFKTHFKLWTLNLQTGCLQLRAPRTCCSCTGGSWGRESGLHLSTTGVKLYKKKIFAAWLVLFLCIIFYAPRLSFWPHRTPPPPPPSQTQMQY